MLPVLASPVLAVTVITKGVVPAFPVGLSADTHDGVLCTSQAALLYMLLVIPSAGAAQIVHGLRCALNAIDGVGG